jgi:hypothetical protein
LDVGTHGSWQVNDAGVTSHHLTLAFGPDPTCTAQDPGVTINGVAATVGTTTKLSPPATIKFGTAVIEVHWNKTIALHLVASGFVVDRRRDLKDDASDPDFEKRKLVVPVLTDPTHYGHAP